jgi:hypothetical protein
MFWVASCIDFVSDLCQAFHKLRTNLAHMKTIQPP